MEFKSGRYGEVFSNTIKVTKGIVSANRGHGDDIGQFQIDAAFHPCFLAPMLHLFQEEKRNGLEISL